MNQMTAECYPVFVRCIERATEQLKKLKEEKAQILHHPAPLHKTDRQYLLSSLRLIEVEEAFYQKRKAENEKKKSEVIAFVESIDDHFMREILTMRCIEGLTIQEIADNVFFSPTWVSLQIHKAFSSV